MTTALWIGLLLGLRHALDPDHVVAVSTLVAREQRPGLASLLGAAWAAGHGSILLAVSLATLAFDVAFPDALSRYAETAVGAVLVILGATNLWAMHHPPHVHGHSRSLWRAGAVGSVHGLAGSGVVVVVAASQLPTASAVASYLLAFGLGTGVGMVACSALLGAPLARAHGPRVRAALHAVTGIASVTLGIGILAGLAFAPSAAAASALLPGSG